MTVKKAYAEIVAHLEENKDKKVSTVLPEIIEMASAKRAGGGGSATTFHKNEAGEVVAVQCYYHKLWMDPRVAEFGAKASSATGLNSMCKDGVSKWTKQQREARNGKEALLTQLANGEIEAAELSGKLAELEEATKAIVPREDGYGFATLEECLADSAERGLS